MKNFQDLTGVRFGRFVVIDRGVSVASRRTYWHCVCDCGKAKSVLAQNLKSGHTVSCGCYGAEQTIKRQTKHGEGETRLYAVWRQMRQRCNSPSHPYYGDYGKRGITFCNDWADFSEFKSWALSNGYEQGLEIERIDNESGYSPDNCRWATRKEQCRNTRRTWKYRGRPVIEICEELGIKYGSVSSRFYTCGWDIEEALFTPIKKRGEK